MPSSGRRTTARRCGARSSSAHRARPPPSATPWRRPSSRSAAHKWIATDDVGGGFALLNDGKYGHRAKSGLLEPQPAALPDLPRQDGRPRHPPLHRMRSVRSTNGDLAARSCGRATGSTTRCGSPTAWRSTAQRGRRRRRRGDRDGEAGRERRRRRAAAVREPRAAHDDGTPGSTGRIARHTRPTLLERPSGTADLDRIAFGPFEINDDPVGGLSPDRN